MQPFLTKAALLCSLSYTFLLMRICPNLKRHGAPMLFQLIKATAARWGGGEGGSCPPLTQEGRRGDGAITPGHHDADPRLHEGHGKVDDLRALLIDRQRAHGHDGLLVHHLDVEGGSP